jgi:hypothetical protein
VTALSFVLLAQQGASTTADGALLTSDVLVQIAAACEVQLNRDVSAHWGGDYRVRAGIVASDIQPGEIVFAVLASLPLAPGAIAYHDVNGQGVPVLFDAITLSDTLVGLGSSLSVAVSHELCETAVDEACNAWRDDGNGNEFAQEACDAVEAQSYAIDGVGMSNFVAPAFFTPNHEGPYDHLSSIGPNPYAPSGPFMTAPGGNYQIVRLSGTGEHQVQARYSSLSPTLTIGISLPFAHTRASRRIAKRSHSSSRTYRRGVRL